MHPLATLIALLTLIPALGCFTFDSFAPIPAPMDLDPWPEDVCIQSQGGSHLLQKELRCFQEQAEHSGNCDPSGSNCEPGCLFTLATQEPSGMVQALVRINQDEFVPEGHSAIANINLQSTPNSSSQAGITLVRLYRGANPFYKDEITLANITVAPTCP